MRAALTDIAHLHFSFGVVPFADACRSHEYHTVLFHFPLIAFVDAHGSHESHTSSFQLRFIAFCRCMRLLYISHIFILASISLRVADACCSYN